MPTSYGRVFDTVNGVGSIVAPMGPGVTRTFQVSGLSGVPESDVVAVAMDVTVRSASSTNPGYMTMWPAGAPRPSSPVVSFDDQATPVTNTVIVPVSADGKVSIYNASGSVQANVDVQGYFTGGDGQGFAPVRQIVANSATGVGMPAGAIDSGTTRLVTVGGATAVPADASAVFAHVMISGGTGVGSVKIFGGSTNPDPAQVAAMYEPAETRSVGMIIPLDDQGRLLIKNYGTAGSHVNVRIDVQGYFGEDSALGFHPASQIPLLDTTSTGVKLVTFLNSNGLAW